MSTSPVPDPGARRLAHLTTIDMSLALLLETELREAIEAGDAVFGISAPGRYVPRICALGVTHVPIPALTRSWSIRSDIAAFVGLYRTLRALDLDVLHTHNPKTGVIGRVAGRLAGVPVVVNTCHGLWLRPGDSRARRLFVVATEAFAARFSDYELFQNDEDLATLRPYLKRGRAEVVGNGVDLETFTPDHEGRIRVRREWGVSDDEILVGGVGRRVAEKGLVEFATMAADLRGRARFVWVGPPDDVQPEPELPSGTVELVDERADIPAILSAFDIFVLPSHREGLSRSAMEAAACGRAMVLSDIRGCREIGTDNLEVVLIPPHDAAALTRAVDSLIRDPRKREELGVAARRRALAHFDQRQVARRSREVYAYALAHRGRWRR